MSNGFQIITDANQINSVTDPLTFASILNDMSLGSLLSDINNIKELSNITSHGWVGSDPLFSHVYILQPPLRNGTYIPRQLIKSVQIPDRVLRTKTFPFKGNNISYAVGYDCSELKITFYENQLMQITAYINAWRNSIIGLAGGNATLMNNYKYPMYFIHNSSLGNPIDTLTSGLLEKVLPSKINSTLQKFEFAGVTACFGCFPISMPFPPYENLKEDSQVELTVTFKVDEIIQMPLSTDIGDIQEILGLNYPRS